MARDTQQEYTAAMLANVERLDDLRDALGLTFLDHHRMDNHGVDRRGRVVVIDYGQIWLPLREAWCWALDELQEGDLELDHAARARLYRAIAARNLVTATPTYWQLAELAGLVRERVDPAVIGALGQDAATCLGSHALVRTSAQPRPAPPAVDVRSHVYRLDHPVAEACLAAASGTLQSERRLDVELAIDAIKRRGGTPGAG